MAAVQTMPFDYRPWGCGSGSKGSCNNTHIQFEICEDALNDKAYFDACYKEACEMTAYLCKMYGIDPKGKTVCNGVTVPTIIDHTGSHSLGLGFNHGDIQHWSRKYGKTMENVRNDVAAILAADNKPVDPVIPASDKSDEEMIWNRLFAVIKNPYGVAGVMGNMKAESNCRSNNLQNTYEKSLGMTDAGYTAAVDDGSYTNFVKDKAGYGLVQWTYWSLKQGLYNYAKSVGKSIGDRDMQVDFFVKQMKEDYKAIWNILTTTKTVREASDAVLLKFERPADQSEAAQMKRAAYGQEFFDKFSGEVTPSEPVTPVTPATAYYRVRKSWSDKASQIGAFTVLQNAKNCVDANPGYAAFDDNGRQVYPAATFQSYKVKISVSNLNIRKGPSTSYASHGYTGKGVFTIVDEQDGWGLLKAYADKRNGWVSLKYCEKI